MEKAIKEVKAIVDELNSLRDIDVKSLDALGKGIFLSVCKLLTVVTAKQIKTHFFFSFFLQFTEKRLSDAEDEVRRADLTSRVSNLVRVKNIQNQWIKNYENEIGQLEDEVDNIKTIAATLPEGCFKRSRLEP